MLSIKYVNTVDLIPYINNSRTHTDEQVTQIASSIKEFGFTNPVLIDEQGGIIAGHGRIMAAKKLGIEEVPTITLVGLSEAQRKAYIIADNQLPLNAGWDLDLLKVEIEQLQELDFNTDLLGFDTDFLDGLLDPEPSEGLTDEDDVPDVPDNPVTVLGDIWQLGNHRLMCGDSTSIDAVEKLMDGKKANICFTSPPYNAGSLNISGNESTKKKYDKFDDNQTIEEFFDFLTSNLDCMFMYSDEIFYNIGLVQNNKRTIFDVISRYGEQFKDIIYWKKKSVAPHIQKGIVNNLVEFIICFGDGNRKFLNPQFSQGSYWNVIEGVNASGNEYSSIHKATFPVYLPENIIKNFTPRNGVVIDCFGGTGTTMIAAEKHSRASYLMELSESYCDVIINRWQDFTGKEAVHVESGKTYKEMNDESSS